MQTTTVEVGERSLGPLRVSHRQSSLLPRPRGTRSSTSLETARGRTSRTTERPTLHRVRLHGFLDFPAGPRNWGSSACIPGSKRRGPARFEGNYFLSPNVYLSTGPGNAKDGKPRFDLRRFNAAYFSRLRQRVIAARERGIYVIVMLFDGWSVERKGDGDNPWDGHPFNRANNINGVDGDSNHDGFGDGNADARGSARHPPQEAYVHRILHAVDDQPNVLYEISNESARRSMKWQNHMVEFVRSTNRRSRRHPVGITSMYPGRQQRRSLRECRRLGVAERRRA